MLPPLGAGHRALLLHTVSTHSERSERALKTGPRLPLMLRPQAVPVMRSTFFYVFELSILTLVATLMASQVRRESARVGHASPAILASAKMIPAGQLPS